MKYLINVLARLNQILSLENISANKMILNLLKIKLANMFIDKNLKLELNK